MKKVKKVRCPRCGAKVNKGRVHAHEDGHLYTHDGKRDSVVPLRWQQGWIRTSGEFP